jgi:copper transporter 1
MDHKHIHHHDMDHMSGHACSMKMTFNWDIEGICVIFDWWQISDITTLILSMILIFVFATFYEKLRQFSSSFDRNLVKQTDVNTTRYSTALQFQRALLYGAQVGISFLLMLIFMTYNAFLMLAVVAGAICGFFFFNHDATLERSMACH